jgi:hypothetical protein
MHRPESGVGNPDEKHEVAPSKAGCGSIQDKIMEKSVLKKSEYNNIKRDAYRHGELARSWRGQMRRIQQ